MAADELNDIFGDGLYDRLADVLVAECALHSCTPQSRTDLSDFVDSARALVALQCICLTVPGLRLVPSNFAMRE